MSRMVYVTADWKRVVPASSPQAAFGVALADVDRLGLRGALEDSEKVSAPPAEKQAPRARDKQAPRARDKGRKSVSDG